MLAFFNNCAEDLGHTINNLNEGKYPHLRGVHLKTSTSLNFIHTVVLPMLTSLFDHLAAYEFGSDIIRTSSWKHHVSFSISSLCMFLIVLLFAVNDLQVACYKMLSSLYTLGTDMTLAKGRKYVRQEIDRHRPQVGSCIGAFASTFPIAYLEPGQNKNNPHSLHHKLQDPAAGTGESEERTVILIIWRHSLEGFHLFW